ncbi:MAG: hypothetical protein FJ147_24985 [Deltaproteobacteria bacterium]|nr:hypothetical protein [Deltaproteobacteria bacterium]
MRRVLSRVLTALILILCPPFFSVAAADDSAEVKALKKQVESLQRTVEQLQNAVQSMQGAPARPPTPPSAQPAPSAIDSFMTKEGITTDRPSTIARTTPGAAAQRYIDLSFIPSFFAGASSKRDSVIQTLQGGGHDPRKRGFTLAEGELGLSGIVDPYFEARAYITTFLDAQSGETNLELEEAFLTTRSLPYGLQLEVGHFLTEFGQINPRHPHQWDWIDQPIVNNRLFGPDGIRAPGFRASVLLPKLLPGWWKADNFSSIIHVGMQNANGETMTSFLGGRHEHSGGEEAEHEEEGEEHEHALNDESIGFRPRINRDTRAMKDFTYLARWENFYDFRNGLSTNIGASGLYGPNATGPRGDTWIYGVDMKWRWRPNNSFRGWPFVTWQTELMRRDYHADRFTLRHEDEPGEVTTIPGRTLEDWGAYSQLLYGFYYGSYGGWATGVRYEYAGSSGQSIGGRQRDPFRADRHRVSPLLIWQPSEFTRIRLQYNFDNARHLAGSNNAHSIWLGFQWLYGQHPPHEY